MLRLILHTLLVSAAVLHIASADVALLQHELCTTDDEPTTAAPPAEQIGQNNASTTTTAAGRIIPCELVSVTSADEQKAILASVCNSTGTESSLHLVPTVRRRRIDAGAPLADHCAGRTRGYLQWVSWPFYERFIHVPLDDVNKFLDRRSNGTANSTSDVLIEVLPVHYELIDLQPSLLAGESTSATTNVSIKISETTAEQTANDTGRMIPYAFQQLYDVHVLDEGQHARMIQGMTLRVIVNGSETDVTYGHQLRTLEKGSFNFTSENSTDNRSLHWELIVEAVRRESIVNATLISVYSSLLNESRTIRVRINETKLANVYVTYTEEPIVLEAAAKDPTMTILRSGILVVPMPQPPAVNTATLISVPKAQRVVVVSNATRRDNGGDTVYPGFRPYFYLALIVLVAFTGIVFSNVGWILWNEHQQKIRTVAAGVGGRREETVGEILEALLIDDGKKK